MRPALTDKYKTARRGFPPPASLLFSGCVRYAATGSGVGTASGWVVWKMNWPFAISTVIALWIACFSGRAP